MIITVRVKLGNNTSICEDKESFEDEPVVKVYESIFLSLVLALVIWISYCVITIVRTLNRSENSENLNDEKRTIVTIATVFILTYSSSAVYIFYDTFLDIKDADFRDTFLDLTIASLSNIIPIACVLLTHWKNVGSTGKFLKLAYNIK